MKKAAILATVLIAVCALSTGAWGQNVYRCGNTYSQIPCNGAVGMEVHDARTSQQKAQANKIIARDVVSANAQEMARLKEEALTQEPRPSASKSSKTKTSKSRTKPKSDAQTADTKVPTASDKAKKKKDAEFFTAKVVAEPKKKNP